MVICTEEIPGRVDFRAFKFNTEPGVTISIMGPHQNIVINLTQAYDAEFFYGFLCFFKRGLVDWDATKICIGQMKMKFERIVKRLGFGTPDLIVYEK